MEGLKVGVSFNKKKHTRKYPLFPIPLLFQSSLSQSPFSIPLFLPNRKSPADPIAVADPVTVTGCLCCCSVTGPLSLSLLFSSFVSHHCSATLDLDSPIPSSKSSELRV